MTSQDFRERLLAVLMVALMVASAFPAVLVLGAGGGGDDGDDGDGWSGSGDGHMWPMFARDSAHGGVADTFDRGLSSPGVKWERTATVQSLGTVMGNFTGNVKATNASHTWDDQLHCAVFTTANRVHLVGADGVDVWTLNLTGTFSAAPAIGDVDDDGRSDIVVATRAGVFYAYEPVIRWDGSQFSWWANNTLLEQLWNTTGTAMGGVTASSLVLDDLNGAGPDELLVGTSLGVYCLNARNGNEVWNHTVEGISISIGEENPDNAAKTLSVVTAGYHVGQVHGTLGVIGPTRMDYSKLISLVDYTARAVSKRLTS